MEDNIKTTVICLEMEPNEWVMINVSYLDRRHILAAVRPERRFVKDEIVHIPFPLMWEAEQ